MKKKILDACCGGRMMWFDKKHPDALYIDIRRTDPVKMSNGATLKIDPDMVADFRDMPFGDGSFALVVFDPPQLLKRGGKSWMGFKYGELDRKTWQEDLKAGFEECFRVLRPEGVLIFKWNETDIPLREILKLAPVHPLFGHPSGKASKTHWVTFIK